MLGERDATATVAVKDMDVAKDFYANTLGLKQVATEGAEAVVYRSGTSRILVYESQYAGTNKATAVTWSVGDDVEVVVQALKSKGVTFEHYDLPGMTRKGDVHDAGSLRAAWFKDPDDNIHAIVSG
jgi:catechol 2,3-dioxygenase-like lactoylglutathione lyase family enzyme